MKSKKRVMIGTGAAAVVLTIVAYAATSEILAVGTMPYSDLTNGPAEVTFRKFTSFPGEVGGWHYHPGYVFNVMKSGTITVEDGCGEVETFSAGEAFEKIDGRVHRWMNLGSEPAVEYNTFIVPQGSPLAEPLPERRCGPPRNANECKQGGWAMFTHPRNFGSQGDCVAFTRTRR
jgi:quercetin dioxygenase-like cupin family protein